MVFLPESSHTQRQGECQRLKIDVLFILCSGMNLFHAQSTDCWVVTVMDNACGGGVFVRE